MTLKSYLTSLFLLLAVPFAYGAEGRYTDYGFQACFKDGKAVVKKIEKRYLRRKGLRLGDEMVRREGFVIDREADFRDWHRTRKDFSKGKEFLTFKHPGGETFEVEVKKYSKRRTVYHELLWPLWEDLYAGRDVTVLIHVESVTHVNKMNPGWYEGIRNEMLSSLTGFFTTDTDCGTKMRVVERNRLASLLAELRLQRTGAIASEQVQELGRMSGAQYIAFGSFSRFQRPSGRGFNETMTYRVVKIATGETVSSIYETVPTR